MKKDLIFLDHLIETTLKLLLVIIPAVKKAWLYSRSETDQSIILVHITEDNCKIFLKFEKNVDHY